MSFTMPWATKSNSKLPEPKSNSDKADVSLDDILPTTALRVELVLLVVLCTDAMRGRLNATFEARQTHAQSQTTQPEPQTTVLHDASDNFPLLEVDDNQEANVSKPALPPRPARTNTQDLTLFSKELRVLKAAATTYFNNWRTSLLRRLAEKLKVQPADVKRAKAEYMVSQDAKAKAEVEQRQNWLNWGEAGAEDQSSPAEKPEKIAPASPDTFETQLNHLNDKTRALILNATLFIILSLERYPAHSRILMLHLSRSFNLPDDILTSAEATLASTLQQHAPNSDSVDAESASSAHQSQAHKHAQHKKWKIGLATVAGATLIGITGGLAAPFLLGAAGAIMGGVGLGGLATLLGATIANPVTVAALFGVLGGRMGRKTMKDFTREIEDFEILPVDEESIPASAEADVPPSTQETRPNKIRTQMQTPTQSHLRLALGVSGHLLSEADILQPWLAFSSNSYDPFALRYETAALIKLGSNLNGVLQTTGYALARAGAVELVVPVLSTVLLPVGLLKAGQFLDNPFSIAMERSDKAGVVLAKALIAKVQGERPVTLVGFSVGARVVYSCLSELAKQGQFGLVESAVLVGGPVPSDTTAWVKMRSVVVGRLVNVYTTNDVLLGYLYRVRYAQVGVAGLEAIRGVESVESFDMTSYVKGHGQYRLAIGTVLQEIGFDGLDLHRVDEERKALEQADQEQQEIHRKAKEEGHLDEWEDAGGKIIMMDTTEEAHKEHKDNKTEDLEGHAGERIVMVDKS